MQTYLVLYKTGKEWKKTFSRKPNEAIKRAKIKEGNEANIVSVWAVNWRDPRMAPFCLLGDTSFGKSLVESMVLAHRKENKVGDGTSSKTKPRIKLRGKAVQVTAAKKKKETPTYKPPYLVQVAVQKEISTNA